MNYFMKDKEIIRQIQKGLLRWYDFAPGSRALYIGDAESSLAEYLRECGVECVCAALEDTLSRKWEEQVKAKERFHYLISIADLEKTELPQRALSVWKTYLRADGHMFLGMNNRLGLRYFCGDRDCYTDRSFDGIEDYRRAYKNREDVFRGRMYDRYVLKKILKEAGFRTCQFYSVLSDLENPVLLYSEDYLPNEDLANRLFPTYHCPDTVFLDEEPLYGQMIRNGMFHQTANAYLIECSMDGTLSDVSHVTASMERGHRDALLTVIRRTDVVEKRAAYPEGTEKLKTLVAHGQDLQRHGLRVVEGMVRDGVYQMPYIHAETGQMYLTRLLFEDTDKFLAAMDHFRDLILQSSETVYKEDDGNRILRRAYLDLVPLNSFFTDGEFIFYDQEFCEENYSANVLLFRMVSSFYAGHMEFERILPEKELLDRYGLLTNLERWQRLESSFLGELLHKKELHMYHENCRRNAEITFANRIRINYSEAEYRMLFTDIFQGINGRKLVLFGSGAYAKRFLGLYGRDYPNCAIVDNNREKWGQKLDTVTIQSPDFLYQMSVDDYKVLICVKNYLSVIRQMQDMGVKHYAVFDPSRSYPRETCLIMGKEEGENKVSKRYQTGYVAGVFDMFHVGHLNLLRRAKEQCAYLIVGVVTDEGSYRKKKKYPVIPCEDRMEVIRSCRYVDQVEELPVGFDSVRDAYKLFHFDCQFTGTDYVDSPNWLADKAYLEKQGADLVFFPYTEKISSSMLREELNG